MTVTPDDIAIARALRDEARELASAHFDEIRADLSARTIGQRIKLKALGEAAHLLEESLAVAADNKLVIGVSLAGLAGWFARKPLAKLFGRIRFPHKSAGKLSWTKLSRTKPSRVMERLWPWFVK